MNLSPNPLHPVYFATVWPDRKLSPPTTFLFFFNLNSNYFLSVRLIRRPCVLFISVRRVHVSRPQYKNSSYFVFLLILQKHDNCAYLGYYASSSSNPVPTFRDIFEGQKSKKKAGDGSTRCRDQTTIPRFLQLRRHMRLQKSHTGVTVSLLGFLTLEDGTDRLPRNIGKELPLLAA
jgi:hypothetical protein